MPHKKNGVKHNDEPSPVKGIADDVEHLLEEHVQLLRQEFKEELRKVKGGAASVSAGVGMLAVGSILGGMTAAHLLHAVSRLPLWFCYGAVSGALGAVGAQCIRGGLASMADVQLIPPRTAPLKEDITTLGGRLAEPLQ